MENAFLIFWYYKICNFVNYPNLKKNCRMRINCLEDHRLKELQDLAELGDVDKLFSVLTKDLYVLEDIEKIPLVSTPLHTAVSQGNIHFAKEIVNLKPSLTWKRDEQGLSPLHLALEGKHLQKWQNPRDPDLMWKYRELIKWLIKHDSGLVRVKAMGLVTPLHYAAQVDDESSLAEFLHACPSSIEDLTVKSETAVHVAIKKGRLKAFKVLLGWLRRFDKLEILSREDEEGNNALHTAVSARKHEMVKLLLLYMRVNIRNSKGLTALDVFNGRQGQGSVDAAVKDILLAAKAKTASQLQRPSLVEKFLGVLTYLQIIIRQIYFMDYRRVDEISREDRNVLLVVAVLVATATYQAPLSPPGGFWQDDGNPQPTANNATISNISTTTTVSSTKPSEHLAGEMIMESSAQLILLTANSFAFFTSMCLIHTLLAGLPFSLAIMVMMTCMAFSYCYSIFEISSNNVTVGTLFPIYLAVGYAVVVFPGFLNKGLKMLLPRKLGT
ncbi:ankyrin repeat-containing protein BDA1-like isoform X2 [Mangifera indica]|uniref:ankyrin repeat-containing protein BDA1-like isoform X2 n=1 Tax=Mangifera indica TaxID=29780 RepID=UPI001CF9C2EA|nr:ankyrin repeat-containing protein BDA1-like isoform X2 [Mangifera indica]